jgi:hypothetical protein
MDTITNLKAAVVQSVGIMGLFAPSDRKNFERHCLNFLALVCGVSDKGIQQWNNLHISKKDTGYVPQSRYCQGCNV